jgi:hypothetical protein
MIKRKKSGRAAAFLIPAAALLTLVFASCQQPEGAVKDEVVDSLTGVGTKSSFDPVGIVGYGGGVIYGDIPIPYARILKTTTTGENDIPDPDNTTTPAAAWYWPSNMGRDKAGHNRTVERRQFVIEWKREGPKTTDEIATAIENVYDTYMEWRNSFDPLPFFESADADDPSYNSSYIGRNIGRYPSSVMIPIGIGIGADYYLNQSGGAEINFIRYWPPATVTKALGLTPYLSKASWDDPASLAIRIEAYNLVRSELEDMYAAINSSVLRNFQIPGGSRTPLQEVWSSLGGGAPAGVYRVGPNTADPPTNLSSLQWIQNYITQYNSNYSGTLFEAYFGFVPPSGDYYDDGVNPNSHDPTYPDS